jgi:hypothetical protein
MWRQFQSEAMPDRVPQAAPGDPEPTPIKLPPPLLDGRPYTIGNPNSHALLATEISTLHSNSQTDEHTNTPYATRHLGRNDGQRLLLTYNRTRGSLGPHGEPVRFLQLRRCPLRSLQTGGEEDAC